jgi:hypothetical protein
MNRREWLKSTGTGVALAGVGGSAVLMEGCNATTWITMALNDLPVILQIITSILAVIGAAKGSVSASAMAIAQKAANDASAALLEAQTFIKQYQANSSTTLLGQIDDALTTAQSQLGAILGVLHVTDTALQATLAAGIGSALTIIVAIQALVPVTPVATVKRAELAKSTVDDQSIAIKAAYNECVTAAGGGKYAI